MQTDFAVFRTVLYYSVAIITLPLSTFFTTKLLIFDKLYGTSEPTGNVYAAVSAVLMLHVTLGAFVYKAYSGDDTPTPASRRLDKEDKFE